MDGWPERTPRFPAGLNGPSWALYPFTLYLKVWAETAGMMAGMIHRWAVIIALAGGLAGSRGQSTGFEPGSILDSIRVGSAPDETYALYVPNGYDPNSPSPIVFIFDPAARGRHAVEFFIPAAER